MESRKKVEAMCFRGCYINLAESRDRDRQLRAFVLMPFLSTRSALFEDSTIDPEYTSLMRAMDVQRAAF
jgi:hypothetical protein